MSDLKTQLEEQLSEIDWQELKPHAQRDVIIVVDTHLDLIEVAMAIAKNETNKVQNWISEQLIQKPTEKQLSNWNGNPSQKFETIIVQPFVLIKIQN